MAISVKLNVFEGPLDLLLHLIDKNKIDILICAGENAKFIAKQAESLGMNKENIFYFKDKNEIVDKLKSIINKDDIILFKASNGMRFFDIVENIK